MLFITGSLTVMMTNRKCLDFREEAIIFSKALVNEPEKVMAPHCSTLAWRIPGTGKPGGLLSMGSHRVGHDCSDLLAAAAAAFWEKMNESNLLKTQQTF